jgi:predicted TIM-barrel fold metal-dependent hydrolase
MRIIDSHTHLMEDGFQYLPGLSLNAFVNLMDNAGIDVSVIFTLAGLIRDFRAHNDELAEAVAEYPDRLVGLGSVNPWYGDEAVEEVRRCFTDLGFAGLKLHPWYTGFLVNSPVMDSVCEVVAEFDKPVFLHTGTPPGSAPLQVGALASRHTRVVFVLGHLGLPDLWTEAVAAAQRHRNIYLETAGAHSLSIRKAVEILGPERVLFGSDSPFGGKNNVFFQRDKISLLGLPERDEERIMSLNAAEIFDVPTAYGDAS